MYIGIGAAFAVVWEFYIGRFVGRFLPSTPFIGVGFWGRLIITFIVAALVRKVGAGMLTLFVFNLLSDIFYYGFGGEPMYFIYESLTYGLFIDLMIAATGGKLFGIGHTVNANNKGGNSTVGRLTASPTLLAVAEGAVLGFLWAIPSPILYSGFFGPFIHGYAPNWEQITFKFLAYIPGDVAMGAIAAVLANRIVKAVGQ